jgi:DNA-binding beta-propeller fold protein YncE
VGSVASVIETLDIQNGSTIQGEYTPPSQADGAAVAVDDEDGRLFVPEPGYGGSWVSGENTLAVIDMETGNVTRLLDGGATPVYALFDPLTDQVLVTDCNPSRIGLTSASVNSSLRPGVI